MIQGSAASLAPLIALGVGAVVAMLLAPGVDRRAVRGIAAIALATSVALAVLRIGTPATVVHGLFLDDGMARFGTVLVGLSGLAALAFLRPALPAREAPALVLLATLGAAVLCGASHAATVFLGLELVTLALISMFVLPLTRDALEAGYKMLILGGAGAGTLLFGFALVYAATGTLALDGWSQRGMLVSLGAALMLAGVAFKFSLVPFHMWTPDAFSGAPAAAAAFAGVGSKIAVALVLLRIDAAGLPEPAWSLGLAWMGAASILLGNLLALRQVSITRMLGYSSIAHSGYLAVILASGAVSAPEAVLFYIASYAPALIAGLCVAALLGGTATLEDARGLLWHRPLAGIAFVLSLLSLAGLPAAVGFFGKFYLFTALIQGQAWALLAIAATGSALGIAYYARFAAVACRQGTRDGVPAPRWPDGAVLTACAAVILALGIYPMPLVQAARLALP